MQCHRLGLDADQLDGIYLTHLHGDHIGGIAMLLVHLQFIRERIRPLVIAGPAETERRLGMLRESAYPSVMQRGLQYPLSLAHWAVPGEVEVLGRTVKTIRARHDRMATATSFVVQTPQNSLAFSGDTGWQPELADLVRGADVFVCECSNVKGDYWGHLSVEELLEHRSELDVGELVLTHMSEQSRVAANEHSKLLGATIADDGLILNLNGRQSP